MSPHKTSAFTLIELLIVVAIIAILAAIAVPNFLEAQVRSKIARVKSDERTVGLALESYGLDNNGRYPPGRAVATPIRLTTPIAYLSGARLKDPFLVANKFWNQVQQWQYEDFYQYSAYPNSYSPKATNAWFVGSLGPAATRFGQWSNIDQAMLGTEKNLENLITQLYDSSNGTTSMGYIMRCGGSVPGGLMSVLNR